MGRWRWLDEWDDDDPALARMREALTPREAITAPDAPEPVVAAPLDTAEEIAALTARIRAGDRSVVDRLRRLLGR
jgi:hypothetical protein